MTKQKGRGNKYKVGELVGPYQLELVERFEIQASSGRIRFMGVFICPFCSAWFEQSIRGMARGDFQSCGCKTKELQAQAKRTHGLSRTKFSKHRHHVISRCYNPKDPRYPQYGGRGIVLCDAWLNNPKEHAKAIYQQLADQGLTLADWGQGSAQYSVDRIRNDGNYEPGNIRFATPTVQINNRSI